MGSQSDEHDYERTSDGSSMDATSNAGSQQRRSIELTESLIPRYPGVNEYGSSIDEESSSSRSSVNLEIWQSHWDRVAQGLEIPRDGYPLDHGRRELLQGIRKSLAIARSQVTDEICRFGENPLYVIRARNARLIMSNIVPDEMQSDHMPYCIWYPDFATEETYAKLQLRYPEMRYNVARACAAAGFTALYQQLDVLPEVSVAEEARDGGEKCGAIFDLIMQAPMRYSSMNDYTCTVRLDSPRSPAFLNGDTAVRSMLSKPPPMVGFYFDITEDDLLFTVDEEAVVPYALTDDEVRLIHSPLPHNLPTVNKDLLILVAAFQGDIDRYARLRRPVTLQHETACVLRGMLHNPAFSLWMETQISPQRYHEEEFKQYACCRRLMSNDLSWLQSDFLRSPFPEVIWNPQMPHENTLAELVRRAPSTAPIVARACIIGNYKWAFDQLPVDWELEPDHYWDAKASTNPYYMHAIEERTKGTDWCEQASRSGRGHNREEEESQRIPTTNDLDGWLSTESVRSISGREVPWTMLNNQALGLCTADRVNNYIFASECWREAARKEEHMQTLGLHEHEVDDVLVGS